MEKISVGSRLRAIREERRLSQRELAKKAGLSTNAISLIERDENSPSVATLQSLAAALNVKISYFFDDHAPSLVLLSHAEQRPAIEAKGVRIEGLEGRLEFQEMEPFIVSLQPHTAIGERQVVHSGHELIYCLSGQVEYVVDGQVYTLQTGDMLLFEASLPHLWRNRTDQPATFLLVLQASGRTSESVRRHFSDYPSVVHIGKG